MASNLPLPNPAQYQPPTLILNSRDDWHITKPPTIAMVSGRPQMSSFSIRRSDVLAILDTIPPAVPVPKLSTKTVAQMSQDDIMATCQSIMADVHGQAMTAVVQEELGEVVAMCGRILATALHGIDASVDVGLKRKREDV